MTERADNMPECGVSDDAARACEEAVFHWDIRRDTLHWSDNARIVLRLDESADIGSGRAFALLTDSSHADLRREAMEAGSRRGQKEYAVGYRLMPQGRGRERGFMVVERGRWVLDAQGEPAHIFGTIRPLDCGSESTCNIPGQPEMDPTSGLFCRSYFFKRLEAFLREDAPRQRGAAVLLASLRNYSIIFDAYGFEVADAAYTEVARRLNQVLRAGDVIARYGDNRIAILLHDCLRDDLEPAMQRFLQHPVQEPVDTEVAPVWPILSIGAVVLPQQARTLTEAISCAEEALSEAENAPASRAVVYSSTSDKVSRRAMKARFANQIFDALRQRRFTLAFQPILHADGGIMCHEALLRVFDDEGKVAPATHLIPVAEELGLIQLVDMEVLELALQALREQPEGTLSFNVSGITVMAADAFLERLARDEELVRGRLIVEVTESAALSGTERINAFIDRLHALGCRVALDDFGAGYTSFKNLRDFHFDIVKLDGAFCERLSENPRNQHFVRSFIELTNNIDNLKVVAEWVESEEDAALLREWGVHALQGYLLGAPEMDGHWRAPCLEKRERTLVLSPRREEDDATGEPRRQEPQLIRQRADEAEEADTTHVEHEEPDAPAAPAAAGEPVSSGGALAASVDMEEAEAGGANTTEAGSRGSADVKALMRALESDLRRLRELLSDMRADNGGRGAQVVDPLPRRA